MKLTDASRFYVGGRLVDRIYSGNSVLWERVSTIFKANNTNNLNLTTSWVNSAVPTLSSIAVWDSRVTAANGTTFFNSNVHFGGIRILNPGTNITINSYNNTLTLSSGGIDMLNSTRNLNISANIDMSANQTWSLSAGRLLDRNASNTNTDGVRVNNNGYQLTVAGDGRVQLAGFTGASGLLRKNGNSLLEVFAGTYDHAGTIINNGTFSMRGGGTNGSIGIVLSAYGGTLDLSIGSTAWINVNRSIDLYGDFSIVNNNVNPTGSAITYILSNLNVKQERTLYVKPIRGTTNAVVRFNNAFLEKTITFDVSSRENNFLYFANISGANNECGVVKTGAGTLSATYCRYTGTTAVSSGKMAIRTFPINTSNRLATIEIAPDTLTATFTAQPLPGDEFRILNGPISNRFNTITLLGTDGNVGALFDYEYSVLTISSL